MLDSKQESNAAQKQPQKEETLGIAVSKDKDLTEWYTQVVLRTELADYSTAKGFMVIRPYGYEIWELIRDFFDSEIKKTGHRNAYFPTLIPESLLRKEAEHFSGFTPEVFWVTKAGNDDLQERFAVRPTSETIIHESMKKWIRSWRDLPMLLNLWNSVLRAEIKSTKPFIRTSEYLWQEGHTAHASESEADKEVMDILYLYKRLIEQLLAVPVLVGKKSEREKFVGALYTTTLEAIMPDGKAVQMGTSHQLGQNFSKPFEISFLDEDGSTKNVWQTSWGVSWRLIGAVVMEHGDDKGLILPPRVAPIQAIIVPILFSSRDSSLVLKKCAEIDESLRSRGFRIKVDARDNYTPGWKYNEWELKGVPVRIEVGPRDVANHSVILVRRDIRRKEAVKQDGLAESLGKMLDEVQCAIWSKASDRLRMQTSELGSLAELKDAMEHKGGFVKAGWCGSEECETRAKKETGADIRVIPFNQEEKKSAQSNCIVCGSGATHVVYFARAY